MNRFRTKKKAKEAEGVVRAPSTDSEAPPLPSVKPSKTFRLGRKNQEPEPKPEINLVNALPSSDDFRTSLLMSGLSARFSMLREQDDPKSKIGKASDDSVLFPKRQSRLNDFGFQAHGLSDIAEVSSINGSIRPPFGFARTDSYHTADGYGTDDDSAHGGSIMSRPKPGEGNNLFGGRQKIYKIPVSASGSAKNLTDGTGSGMGGRALYGDDVSQSAFQKLREREREQEREEREAREEKEAQSSRPSSPPLSGYNRNRETSSTTSSAGPSNTRTSTAATSVTSQRTPSLSGSHTPISPSTNGGLERSTTKGRRLYETGLDQHLHEQQYSAMSRIDTLTRQRNLGAQTPPLISSPTGLNQVGERWERQQIAGKGSMPNLRAASPPPAGAPMGTFDFGVKANNANETKAYGLSSPPLSPPVSENDDHAVLPVQPNDRGKATALGAFAKPAQPYDENKYSQRQLQMQQGRETPPLRKQSPPRAFNSRQQQQQQIGRNRADSNATFASGRSRSSSSAQRHFLPHDRIPESPATKTQAPVPENRTIASGTLSSPNCSSLGSPNDTEQETSKARGNPQPLDLSRMYHPDHRLNLERPPESQHPANRQRPFNNQGPNINNARSPSAPVQNSQNTAELLVTPPTGPPADSPTLGPTTGLSGMVRQHLRSDSNTSSVYGGMPSAGLVSRFPVDHSEPMPQNEYTTRDNPWDTDDWDQGYDEGNKFSLDEKPDVRKTDSALPPPLSVRSPNADVGGHGTGNPSWEKDTQQQHTRNVSTETQKERQDFRNELASRRRRVQENLKSFVETESRSASPNPGTTDWSRDPLPRHGPLDLLKNKPSKSSLNGKSSQAGQSKAMKMLGLGNTTTNSSPSPGKQTFDDQAWKQEEEEMFRGVVKPSTLPPQTKAFRQARRDAQRDRERQVAVRHQQRMAAEANEGQWTNSTGEDYSRQRSQSNDRASPNVRTGTRDPSRDRPPPVALSHSYCNGSSQESKGSVETDRAGSRSQSRAARDRSSSDASGRSKSRNGRYRDDLAKAMAEGTSSSSQGTFDDLEVPPIRFMPKSPRTPNIAFQQSPMPSPVMASNARSRSNSKSTPAGYFDPQKLQALHTEGLNNGDISMSPRPSPGAPPFSANPTPPLIQPSPAGSGANTPTTQGFQSQGRVPANRKRSINKSDISEPTLISSTSRITTVNLPPGSSLQNGVENAPPIPPVNPRRRQTRAMFGAFMGRKDEQENLHSMPAATQSTEEMSTFSADEGDSKPKSRQRLRKSSSEGGNLNSRARHVAISQPSPAMPTGTFPPGSGSPPRLVDGGMF
jgi:hypothetical protein